MSNRKSPATAPTPYQYRPLNVRDALSYLDQVKVSLLCNRVIHSHPSRVPRDRHRSSAMLNARSEGRSRRDGARCWNVRRRYLTSAVGQCRVSIWPSTSLVLGLLVTHNYTSHQSFSRPSSWPFLLLLILPRTTAWPEVDAILELMRQIQFQTEPEVYNRFLDVMKEFKGQM